jgi:hypothetical protein
VKLLLVQIRAVEVEKLKILKKMRFFFLNNGGRMATEVKMKLVQGDKYARADVCRVKCFCEYQ